MNISDLREGDEVYVRARVTAIEDTMTWVRTFGDDLFLIVASDLAPVQPVDAARIVEEQKEKCATETWPDRATAAFITAYRAAARHIPPEVAATLDLSADAADAWEEWSAAVNEQEAKDAAISARVVTAIKKAKESE